MNDAELEERYGTAYLVEVRDKYNAQERKDMAGKEAMPDESFPIKDKDDVEKAIKAVGLGGSSHDAIRKHIMARAAALNLSSMIPDSWGSDGSVKEANAAEVETEQREAEMEACPTCDGSGKIKGGSMDCPDCDGSGEVAARSTDQVLERRQRIARDLEGTYEHRQFSVSDMELRESSDGTLRFTGYASTTEHPYEVADFTETIARGAFKRTLSESPDVVLLLNHSGLPLARTKSGTLTLAEDARGLRVDADLEPNDPDVKSLQPKLQRRDLDSMSFAFRATAQTWNDDYTERLIRGVSLHQGDVSIVTMAANPDTAGTVSIRSDDGEFEIRAGKAISKAKEKQIKQLVEKLTEAGDELTGLLPPEPEPDPVVPFEPQYNSAPDLTTRAAQELELLTVRGGR